VLAGDPAPSYGFYALCNELRIPTGKIKEQKYDLLVARGPEMPRLLEKPLTRDECKHGLPTAQCATCSVPPPSKKL